MSKDTDGKLHVQIGITAESVASNLAAMDGGAKNKQNHEGEGKGCTCSSDRWPYRSSQLEDLLARGTICLELCDRLVEILA